MQSSDKPIVLSSHTAEQAQRRGTREAEIIETMRTAPWQPAELGRMECAKNFPFDGVWNGRPYAMKRVRPIFAEEPGRLVVVTVYVYYLKA